MTNDAGILRIYAPAGDPFRIFGRLFDQHDMIVRPLTLMERASSFIRGRGW